MTVTLVDGRRSFLALPGTFRRVCLPDGRRHESHSAKRARHAVSADARQIVSNAARVLSGQISGAADRQSNISKTKRENTAAGGVTWPASGPGARSEFCQQCTGVRSERAPLSPRCLTSGQWDKHK